MRILLTGAHGQLGRVLNEPLTTFGDVVTVDRDAFDLTDKGALRNSLDIIRPELIVNTAAFTDVDGAEAEPDAAHRTNTEAPGTMAQWASENQCALIHYSTDYVFDGSGDKPWTEEDCTAPLNVYGRSKRDGERAVLATSAPSLVIRTSWLYAAHGANFLLTMLRLGAERDALNIVGDQFGAPTSVGLLGDVTVEILRQSNGDFHELLSQRGRLLHVTASGVTSWHGFAEAIFADARERGIALAVKNVTSIPSQDYPLPAQRPLNSRLALDRLKDRFGITPPSWRDALNKVMEELSRSA